MTTAKFYFDRASGYKTYVYKPEFISQISVISKTFLWYEAFESNQ